jgi:hypothetical protein
MRHALLRAVTALASALVLAPAASAATDNRAGCIVRDAGQPARFVVAGSLDRAAQWKVVQQERALRPQSKGIDSCRLGLRRDLTADVYARLAARHPDRYAPLPKLAAPKSTLNAAPARAPNYSFRDISSVFTTDSSYFISSKPWGRRSVLGTMYRFSESGAAQEVTVVEDGVARKLGDGFGFSVNASGLVGGSYNANPDGFQVMPALFRGGVREPIPLSPEGVEFSLVSAVADNGNALVEAYYFNGSALFALWDGMNLKTLHFGPEVPFAFELSMNGRGVIAGNTERGGMPIAFRHDTRTGVTTLLPPVAGDLNARATDINSSGQVLGYSYTWDGAERIGTWDARGQFNTRLLQGTSEVPTISSTLRFNDAGLIAISGIVSPEAEVGRLYLLQPGGSRIDARSATRGMPAGIGFGIALAVSNVGNVLGAIYFPDAPDCQCEDFMLLRDGR